MTTINITPVTTPDELHCHYGGRHETQDCYLALDLEDGELTCAYNPEIGSGIPKSVWAGRAIRWTIPCLTDAAANMLMAKAQGYAQQIVDDTEIEWDGDDYVGRPGPDAAFAAEQIADLCIPDNWGPETLVAEYDAGDWYHNEGTADAVARLGLTADTTDQQIDDMANAEVEEAKALDGNDGYVILTGVEDWLIETRRELREQLCDALEAVAEQLAELTGKRNTLIRHIGEWKDADGDAVYSTRTVGDLAGLSHTHVQRILARQD